jgi:2-polyprenyl-6-methoxyphenol hydroxylase-like FAD-dependent oxidoreductase
MQVLIAGGGIGGLAAALSLHQAGIGCTVFE